MQFKISNDEITIKPHNVKLSDIQELCKKTFIGGTNKLGVVQIIMNT